MGVKEYSKGGDEIPCWYRVFLSLAIQAHTPCADQDNRSVPSGSVARSDSRITLTSSFE